MARRRANQLADPHIVHERAGISVRVSLDKTAHGMADEIVSPETQEDRCRAYCESQGWDVAMVERDIDESAWRQHYSQREGLMRLLRAVERGEITKIVVFKFNRLSRRLSEFTEICDTVEEYGAGVVSVTEQVDTSTPSGRLIRNIMASFAQYQSEEISEQISETWLTKAKNGLRPPGRAPYGTRYVKGALIPDEATHETLQDIFRLFVETRSVAAVVQWLNERQIPAQQTDRWSLLVVRRILANPAYVGVIELNGETFEGRWDPIIPVDLWDQAQAIMDSRRTKPFDRVDSHMLRGHVICSECGRPMWSHYEKRWQNKKLGRDRYYWCADPKTLRDGCAQPAVHAEELEHAVWSLVRTLCQDRSDTLLEALEQRAEADDSLQRRQRLARERDRVELQVRQLFELLADGTIDRARFATQNRIYADRLSTIQREIAELDRLQPEDTTPDLVRRAIQLAGDVSSIPEKRAVLAALEVEVEVTWKALYMTVLGIRIRLRARLLGERWYLGDEYQRLDYQGTMLTDKQLRFVQRTYLWADKKEIARRIGRSYQALKSLASRMRQRGELPPAKPGPPKGKPRAPRRTKSIRHSEAAD